MNYEKIYQNTKSNKNNSHYEHSKNGKVNKIKIDCDKCVGYNNNYNNYSNYNNCDINWIECRVCKLNKVYGGKDICQYCASPKGLDKYSPKFGNNINDIKKTPDEPFVLAMTKILLPTGNTNCTACENYKPKEFRSGNTTAPR